MAVRKGKRRGPTQRRAGGKKKDSRLKKAVVDNEVLHVDQRCAETLACLDQYQWDPNPNLAKEKPKHNRASHMADALRYALYSFETSNTGF